MSSLQKTTLGWKNLEYLEQLHAGLFALLLAITILIQTLSKTVTSLDVLYGLYGITLVGLVFHFVYDQSSEKMKNKLKQFSFVFNSLLISSFLFQTANFSPFLILIIVVNILVAGFVVGLGGSLLVAMTSILGYLTHLFWVRDLSGAQLALVATLNSMTFLVVGAISGYLNEVLFETKEELIETRSENERLAWDLQQKEKLAAIGQLAAGIAHEIRNPLASISGSIEMLSQTTHDSDDQKLMKIVLKEINRLNLLITDFLDYAKPEKPPTENVLLESLVEEALQSLRLSLGHSNSLKNELMIDSQIQKAKIKGYSGPLKQVLLNFFINAVHAMKDQDTPQLKVKLSAEGDKVILSIEDNGCGMSQEIQQRIFEPFFTTKSKGTGLGLAMTHKILTVHAAQVVVESKVGAGTRFVIQFPQST